MTVFLNPTDGSYLRLGGDKAPGYITWSSENRSQLIRIPAASGEFRRAELRSPDPGANPYIAFTLMISAGMYGVDKLLALPPSTDVNLYAADEGALAQLRRLPATRREAQSLARSSEFIKNTLPAELLELSVSYLLTEDGGEEEADA